MSLGARTYTNPRRRKTARWDWLSCGWCGVRGLRLTACPMCDSEQVAMRGARQ